MGLHRLKNQKNSTKMARLTKQKPENRENLKNKTAQPMENTPEA